MKKFNINLREFEKKYNMEEGFFNNENIIIDNEIQNDISKNWDYESAKISVVGILYENEITIFAIESVNDEDFKNQVIEEINKLGKVSHIYAFNRKMEIGNFKGDWNFDVPIKEIKPFNSRGYNKDKFFQILKERKQIPNFDIIDIFDGNAGLCIDRWEKFVATNDFQNIIDVVKHNINCLLKESIILKHQKFFKDNWEVDDRNWMLCEKKKEE